MNNQNNNYNNGNNYGNNVNPPISNTNDEKQIGLIFLIISILSMLGFFIRGTFLLLFIAFALIGFIGSIVVIRRKEKFGVPTLIISIISLAIYVLAFIISAREINNMLDNIKVGKFRENANSFIYDVYQDSVFVNKTVGCEESQEQSLKKSLDSNGTIKRSPFGNSYDFDTSYVLIEAKDNNGNCEYKRYIYLTDGKYSLGTPSEPVEYDNVYKVDLQKK